jgi:hypothetical protein
MTSFLKIIIFAKVNTTFFKKPTKILLHLVMCYLTTLQKTNLVFTQISSYVLTCSFSIEINKARPLSTFSQSHANLDRFSMTNISKISDLGDSCLLLNDIFLSKMSF